MKNVVVVGSQWGDEGKGKIVDWLSSEADVIIRFQGGHNAGHTLVIDGIVYKLRLLPSGIVRKNKISIIGNGVVVDPWALLEEIDEIHQKFTNCLQKMQRLMRFAENLPNHGKFPGLTRYPFIKFISNSNHKFNPLHRYHSEHFDDVFRDLIAPRLRMAAVVRSNTSLDQTVHSFSIFSLNQISGLIHYYFRVSFQ